MSHENLILTTLFVPGSDDSNSLHFSMLYNVTNTGSTSFDYRDVVVRDSYGEHPRLDQSSDVGADQKLSPGEVWRYVTTATAEELTVVMSFEQDGNGADLQRGTQGSGAETISHSKRLAQGYFTKTQNQNILGRKGDESQPQFLI